MILGTSYPLVFLFISVGWCVQLWGCAVWIGTQHFLSSLERGKLCQDNAAGMSTVPNHTLLLKKVSMLQASP